MKKSITPDRRALRWFPYWICALFCMLFSPASAQTEGEGESEEDIQELSPFVVEDSENVGYLATRTLAGTRLNTPLRDVASSITVVTKEVLDDTGSTDLQDILIYTPNTEIPGIGGNIAGGSEGGGNMFDQSTRRDPESATRVRGLAEADRTRNFIKSSIPFDAYNANRLVINRGANSILFGLGSPAGIINYNTITADFLEGGEFELRYGSYGSTRAKLDYQTEIIEDKLAARMALVYDDEKYRQDHTFERAKRGFATITYKPFEQTTIRINAEDGEIEANRPMLVPPTDFITRWWDPEAHPDGEIKMAHNAAVTTAFNVGGDNLFSRYIGPGPVLWSPAVYWDEVGNPNPSFSTVSGADGVINSIHPRIGGRLGLLAVPRGSQVNIRIARPEYQPIEGFFINEVLSDPGVFNFYENTIWGPNADHDQEFDNFQISLEQNLGKWAGIEFNYYREDSLRTVYELGSTGGRSQGIFVDVTEVLHTGDVNPNFGRPMVGFAGGGDSSRRFSEAENYRATGFVRFAADDFGVDGILGKLFGAHTITALYEKNDTFTRNISGPAFIPGDTYLQFVTPDGGNSPVGNTWDVSSNVWRQGGGQVYLGSSLFGLDDPSQANIQGLQTRLVIPETVTYKVWDVNQGAYVNAEIPIERNVVTDARMATNEVDTLALLWQYRLWDDLVVATLGWRQDDVESRDDLAPRDSSRRSQLNSPEWSLEDGLADSVLENDGDTIFSWGVVANLPENVKERLPFGLDGGVHYSKGENSRVGALRVDFLGNALAPEGGETEEKGFTLSFLDNRLSLRANWYETSQTNVDVGLGSALANSINWDLTAWNNAPDVIAANPFDQDNIGELINYPRVSSEIASRFNVVYDEANGRSVTFQVPAGMTIVSDVISEGFELELLGNITPEWSVMLNVSRQEATQGAIDSNWVSYVRGRLAELEPFLDFPLAINSAASIGERFNQEFLASMNIAVAQEGSTIADEIREWRANLITNYRFKGGSFLDGWRAGGALRWQDQVAGGFPVIFDDEIGDYRSDVDNPIFGPEEFNVDAWVGYERELLEGKLTWNVQLNIRNLLGDDDLIPVQFDPDGAAAVYRIPSERTYEVRSSFRF